VPGYEVTQWYGLLAPSGTPREVVRRLNGEIVKFLQRPDTAAKMLGEGAMPFGTTPEQFQDLIKVEIARWAPVIKASGARAE
jgi:tripartite-type tricarboxylate transporter receptor subunit TctC